MGKPFPQLQIQVVSEVADNKFIKDNNQKALELLLRIQNQLEASRVIAISTSRENNYE